MIKFLTMAASPEGACAWDEKVPAMQNDEMAQIQDLVYADETDPRVGVVWRITDAGRARLS